MTFKKPVIAAIEGAAVAGGFELSLCADLRVASENAYFGFFNRNCSFHSIDLNNQLSYKLAYMNNSLEN